jgi:hypothetical protein
MAGNTMSEWRVDYNVVKGFAEGNAGRVLIGANDEIEAKQSALEAGSDEHGEIAIVKIERM